MAFFSHHTFSFHSGLDECDGLPHRDKDIEKLLSEIHHNKREHLIVPPISSAASLVESALERKDSKHQTSSSSSNEHTTKKGVKLKKKGQRKQRPRSFVLSNGNSRNSVLNAELTQKLATLKKTRSGSDPVTVEMGKILKFSLDFSFSFLCLFCTRFFRINIKRQHYDFS
jgi:hypothetical protein